MQERWRCEDYLRWVASHECSCCHAEFAVQAHHFKGLGGMSGAALKAPDHWTMPLCADCHRDLHERWGRVAYQRQWEWSARTMGDFISRMARGLGDETMVTLVRGVAHMDTIGGRSGPVR